MRSRACPLHLYTSLALFYTYVRGNPSTVDDTVEHYYSRPDLNSPKLQINKFERDYVEPGLLFLAPWAVTTMDNGPHIYNVSGELIWAGGNTIRAELTQSLHVCDYSSAPHLCMFEGRSEHSWGKGRGVILNSNYELVKTIEMPESIGCTDMHEFRLAEGGKVALVTSYSVEAVDLTAHNITQGLSYVLNGRFWEIDVETGRLDFEWSALDHIDPGTSQMDWKDAFIKRANPYDFAHLNSVEKDMSGDYVVSARGMNSIYKISKLDGSIIWKLGEPDNDFEMDFELARQHHVRILTQYGDITILSFFNNGFTNHAKNMSSGMIIEVDELKMTAKLKQEYSPEYPLYAHSQGSVEIFPSNNNTLVNWGHHGTITEHLADGRIVYNATLGGKHAQNYRAYKSNWTGNPLDKPIIWAYAKTPESRTSLYVSWNGATEVAQWRMHGRNTDSEPFKILVTVQKSGFETNLVAKHFIAYVFAEAISTDGTSLANSSIKETFVPSPLLAEYCTEIGCPMRARNMPISSPEEIQAANEVKAEARAKQRRLEAIVFWIKEFVTVLLCGYGMLSLFIRYGLGRRRRVGKGYEKLALEE